MDPTKWDVPFPAIVGAMWFIVLCRAGGTYLLGRLASRGAQHTRIARLMSTGPYRAATQRVNDYGSPVVAISFLTIGFQTLANLAAGATRMPVRRYLPALLVGGLAWALIYSYVGSVGWDLLWRLWTASPVLAILVVLLLAAVIAGYALWRRHHPGAEPEPEAQAAAGVTE